MLPTPGPALGLCMRGQRPLRRTMHQRSGSSLFDTPDLVTMKSGSIHWRRRRKQQEHGQGEQVGLGARVDGMDEGCPVGAK